jgi:hypothetical protein
MPPHWLMAGTAAGGLLGLLASAYALRQHLATYE